MNPGPFSSVSSQAYEQSSNRQKLTAELPGSSLSTGTLDPLDLLVSFVEFGRTVGALGFPCYEAFTDRVTEWKLRYEFKSHKEPGAVPIPYSVGLLTSWLGQRVLDSAALTRAPFKQLAKARDDAPIKEVQAFEQAAWELVDIYVELFNELAPKGYHFGSNEGDGADFGWWPNF